MALTSGFGARAALERPVNGRHVMLAPSMRSIIPEGCCAIDEMSQAADERQRSLAPDGKSFCDRDNGKGKHMCAPPGSIPQAALVQSPAHAAAGRPPPATCAGIPADHSHQTLTCAQSLTGRVADAVQHLPFQAHNTKTSTPPREVAEVGRLGAHAKAAMMKASRTNAWDRLET